MREEQCAYWNRLESEVAMVWRMCRDPLGEDWSSSNPMEGRKELQGRFAEALWDGRCYSHLTFLSNGPVLTQQLDGSCLKKLLLPPFPQGLSGHSAGGCSHYRLRPSVFLSSVPSTVGLLCGHSIYNSSSFLYSSFWGGEMWRSSRKFLKLSSGFCTHTQQLW